MTVTERRTSFKSEIGFKLSTPDGVVRADVDETLAPKHIEESQSRNPKSPLA
jgi:hypothetical protein